MDSQNLAETLLHRWFGNWTEDRPLPEGGGPQMKLWWGKNPEVDAELTRRFGAAAVAAREGAHLDWLDNPDTAVALVLLLDQIPRNVFRDTPDAFASDARARWVTKGLIARRTDRSMSLVHRYFAYMPLMHSEDRVDHVLAVDRFESLLADAKAAGSERADAYANALDYEHKHKAIVDRFGRYPHRNAILGRESTDEERAFLEKPGSSF